MSEIINLEIENPENLENLENLEEDNLENISLQMDTDARNKIVSDIDKSFFVEAGAGSGKTTMLVNRMVAMVEAGIDIDKICAITFTKAAAGEFYERFQNLLIERSRTNYEWKDEGHAGQLPEPTKESRDKCKEALENIDLCFMGTIDSFCRMVLSEHPAKAGIASDAVLISDAEAEIIYKQLYVKICAGEFGAELQEMGRVFQQLYRNPEEIFVKSVAIFMDERNVNFTYSIPDNFDLDAKFASDRDKVLKFVDCLVRNQDLRYENDYLENNDDKDYKRSLDAWNKINIIKYHLEKKWSRDFVNVLYYLDRLGYIYVKNYAVSKYPEEVRGMLVLEKYNRYQKCTISDDGNIVSRIHEYMYSVTMPFILKSIDVISHEMHEKGYMSFFDYLYYLRNMLADDAKGDGKLIKHIRERHSYFLIDEFQDTDPMQAEIFFYLSTDTPAAKWNECVPRPGSLFIVGDPKQSIYRFRGADVSSYLKIKGLFEKNNDEILELTRNFRSTRKLCEYFNRVFTNMLPAQTEEQSEYKPIPLPEDTDQFQGIYKYRACGGKTVKNFPEYADSIQVSNIIETIVNNEEFKIKTKGDDSLRKIRYKDIMVITSSKKKLVPIVEELKNRGIDTRVEGNVPFGTNEALLEVYKLYSSIADYNDRIAYYTAFTSKLIRITEEEYRCYVDYIRNEKSEMPITAENCNNETVLLVASKVKEIEKLRNAANSLSPAGLFEKIMDDFQIYKYAKAEELEVIYYTIELLRNAEQSGIVTTTKEAAEYLSKLINNDSDEERCLSLNDNTDAVHLANLHKVKGLEAPIVILTYYYESPLYPEKRVVHKEDGNEGYFFKLGMPNDEKRGIYNKNYYHTESFPDEYNAEKASMEAEILRQVYVAATRARNALFICNAEYYANGKYYTGFKDLNHWWDRIIETDIEHITPYFFNEFEHQDNKPQKQTVVTDSNDLYEEADKTCVINNRDKEDETYVLKTPSRDKLESKTSGDTDVLSTEELSANDTYTDETYAEEIYDEETYDVESDSADKSNENSFSNVSSDGSSQDNAELHSFPDVLGTMTHKLLEMLVSSRNTIEVEMAVNETINEFMKPSLEGYRDKLISALTEVASTMKSGGYAQENKLPQDMLKTLLEADEVHCEVPFSCLINEEVEVKKDETKTVKTLWNGIMDVIYKKDGKWHIVDWKTNKEGSHLDEKYKDQLEAYKTAFRTIFADDDQVDIDVDAYTYHIDI